LQFKLRSFLGKEAPISDKLKIYVINDEAFSAMNDWVLPFEDWLTAFSGLAKAGAHKIFIDAIMHKLGSPIIPELIDPQILGTTNTSIVSAGFLSPLKIPGRFPYPIDIDPSYSLQNLAPKQNIGKITINQSKIGFTPYGHHPHLKKLINHTGHILFEDFAEISPLFKIDKDHYLPHLFTFAANLAQWQGGSLALDQINVPLNSRHNILINFVDAKKLHSNHSRSLMSLLGRIKKGEKITEISPGDYVLIIPHYYTGNTDFKATPVGKIAGGFINAALINSYLTNSFFSYWEIEAWLTPFLLALVLIIISYLPTIWVFTTLPLALLMLPLLSILSFTYFNTVIYWVSSFCAAGAASAIAIFFRIFNQEKRLILMRHALEGSIAPDKIAAFLRNPTLLKLEAREQIVSVLFIDIVNFSFVSRRSPPKKVFNLLKKMLEQISAVIYQHGGVIDKTMGDGLLCYFGDGLLSDSQNDIHALNAVKCALDIQINNMHIEMKDSFLDSKFSLRIGINTDLCFLGDLGSQKRIDYTIIGNGVNIAKRLESACVANKILISESTMKLLPQEYIIDKHWRKKSVSVKNFDHPILAYELDPSNLVRVSKEQFAIDQENTALNNIIPGTLWQPTKSNKVGIIIHGAISELIAFSNEEIHIKCQNSIPEDLVVSVHLSFADQGINQLAKDNNLQSLMGQILWAQEDIAGGFFFAIKWYNLETQQQEMLENQLVSATEAIPMTNEQSTKDVVGLEAS